MGHSTPPPDHKAVETLAREAWPYPPDPYETNYQPVAVEVGTWAGGTAILLAACGYKVFTVEA